MKAVPTPRIDVSSPRPSGSGPTTPDRRSRGHTEPSPGTLTPWACSAPGSGWDDTNPNRCKAICARCATRVECAALWLGQKPAERKYGGLVWAGFDTADREERRTLGRWHGKQVRG